MSFVSQGQDPAARAKAVLGVTAIHAGIGVLLITGLTYTGVIEAPRPRTPISIFTPEPPPPPPEPAPEASESPPVPTPAPPPAAPRPKVNLSDPAPIKIAPLGPIAPDPGLIARPAPGPVALPSPSPPAFTTRAPVPANGPAGWITTADYPRVALNRGWEGTLSYRLDVGSDGQVDKCSVTASSGRAQLDDTACRLIERRARFEPAIDGNGANVAGSYTGKVTWRIPG